MIGIIFREFSNDWKIFFQWLEKSGRFFQWLEKKFPMVGKFLGWQVVHGGNEFPLGCRIGEEEWGVKRQVCRFFA